MKKKKSPPKVFAKNPLPETSDLEVLVQDAHQKVQAQEQEVQKIPEVLTKLHKNSVFKHEYCDAIVNHCGKGFSVDSFAATLDIFPDMINRWADQVPEFKQARDVALAKSLLFWENMGIQGAMGFIPDFNAGSWIFNMKHRFKWQDRVTVDSRVTHELQQSEEVKELLNLLREVKQIESK